MSLHPIRLEKVRACLLETRRSVINAWAGEMRVKDEARKELRNTTVGQVRAEKC